MTTRGGPMAPRTLEAATRLRRLQWFFAAAARQVSLA